MTEMKKSIKEWVANHPQEILVATATVATIGGFVVLVIYSGKEQNKAIEAYNTWVDDMNKWLNEETEKGNYVYLLDDGTYLTVPTDAKQERVLK